MGAPPPIPPGIYRIKGCPIVQLEKGRTLQLYPSVYPPNAALGSLPSVALSSGQADKQ